MATIEQMGTTPAERAFDTLIEQDPRRAKDALAILQARLSNAGVKFGNKPLPVSIKPHFVSKETHAAWKTSTEKLFDLIERVATMALEDDALYRLLRLPADARPLVAIDPGYKRIAVVARPDMAWVGKALHSYEINCDSPAMMTFSDIIQAEVLDVPLMREIAEQHEITSFDRTKLLLRGLLDAYREAGGSAESPTIAIVDWQDQKTAEEQSATAAAFSALGCPSFTCDPGQLSIQKNKLRGLGRTIDIVYRRVLFPDFMRRSAELEVLIRAYRDRLTCMVNPLRSYVVGCKTLLALLWNDGVRARLPPEARDVAELVLNTAIVDDGLREALSEDRTRTVLKGAFSYGGHEVVIGQASDASTWEDALKRTHKSTWVAQRFQEPPRYTLPSFEGERVQWDSLFANWNPFFFGGRFAGAMTRVSASLVVSITARGALLPSLPVRDAA